MISIENIRKELHHLNPGLDNTLIAHLFSGLLAGVALAVKDPQFARTIDHHLRTMWTEEHKSTALIDPGAPYDPGQMAEHLIATLKDKTESSN